MMDRDEKEEEEEGGRPFSSLRLSAAHTNLRCRRGRGPRGEPTKKIDNKKRKLYTERERGPAALPHTSDESLINDPFLPFPAISSGE